MKNLFVISLIFMLTGCALFNGSEPKFSPAEANLTWEKHQKTISALSMWSITGKLAIFLKNERETANIYWEQNNNNYNIQLTSFIGTHILTIKKNAQGVEIINYDGDRFKGNNAELLIQKISPGLNLPISALQQWIKGNPMNATYTLNEQERVKSLINADLYPNAWEVSYQQYQYYSGVVLPRKLDLKRNDLRLKIAINQWQINKQ